MKIMTTILTGVVALIITFTAFSQSGIINNQSASGISLQPKVDGFPTSVLGGNHAPYEIKKDKTIVTYKGDKGSCTFYIEGRLNPKISYSPNGTATCGVSGPILEVHVGS